MQIAIQGALGSFHHQAALALDTQATIVPQQTFAGVFSAVQSGEAEYGLCAIENTLYGSINEVYRLLEQHNVWILRDIRLQIAQHLIGPRAVTLAELASSPDVQILSQAPALAQVERWLATHLPNAVVETAHDTAGSVQAVVELDKPHTLAIAGRLAASTYNGVVVAKNIQDDQHNYTRFILFSGKSQRNPLAAHGSLILKTNHQPGALVHALQIFADNGSNLTKVDSHPIPDDARHYAFYIDYTLPNHDSSAIIDSLQKQGCSVKLLGEYVVGPTVQTT